MEEIIINKLANNLYTLVPKIEKILKRHAQNKNINIISHKRMAIFDVSWASSFLKKIGALRKNPEYNDIIIV